MNNHSVRPYQMQQVSNGWISAMKKPHGLNDPKPNSVEQDLQQIRQTTPMIAQDNRNSRFQWWDGDWVLLLVLLKTQQKEAKHRWQAAVYSVSHFPPGARKLRKMVLENGHFEVWTWYNETGWDRNIPETSVTMITLPHSRWCCNFQGMPWITWWPLILKPNHIWNSNDFGPCECVGGMVWRPLWFGASNVEPISPAIATWRMMGW